MTVSCRCCYEYSVSLKFGEFIDYLEMYQPLRRDSAAQIIYFIISLKVNSFMKSYFFVCWWRLSIPIGIG
jgi:hypothetical protein